MKEHNEMYMEEFQMGETVLTAFYHVSKEEIVSFATKYDPQFIHCDEEKANQHEFSSVIASGLHTLSISMKLFIDSNILGNEIICGVGLDQVRFLRPVYPEDCLQAYIKVAGSEIHSFQNDRGYVTFNVVVKNKAGENVLSYKTRALLKRKTNELS
jgi:acyl dehydratase